jgi:hypothetical protein
MDNFVKANMLDAGANNAMTENGAISYVTIGTELLDQFGKAGAFRGRDINDVWNDQAKLWGENPEAALRFPFYLRMITRQTNVMGKGKSKLVQKGQGARDEAFKRFLWIAKYQPDIFYRNLWLLPVVGSWKDLWQLLSFDDADKYLDIVKFFTVIAEGILDKDNTDLVKKYMPRIRSAKKCKTTWAKRTNSLAKLFAKTVGWSEKDYRQYKATGEAHKFQTIICQGLYSKINWKAIPGKALLNLISGNFLERHNLTEKYLKWLDTQPVAKFNGYPFELGAKVGYNLSELTLPQKVTFDKQFKNLIETAKKDGTPIKGNVLCALDTSGSMTTPISFDTNISAYDVCVSLGVYFSELNQGAFHNVVAMFDDTSELLKLKGDSFCDKLSQIRHERTAWGSTNVLSIVNLILDTRRKHPEIPIEDYPFTWIVVSDMQFNPTGKWDYKGNALAEQSTYEAIQSMLRAEFPDEIVDNLRIVWWYCSNRQTSDFPATMDKPGMYMVSGFDGSLISTLLGGELKTDENGKIIHPTMEEIVERSLNQEVLALVH